MFTLKKIIFVSLSIIIALFYIDSLNLRNKILINQSNFYVKLSKTFKLFSTNNLKFNNYKDTTCHEQYDIILLEKNCFKNSNSKELVYFFGDSSMHDFYYSFNSLNSGTDQFFSSYNNSSFWKPIFTGYPGSGEPHINFSDKINLFSKQYEKIYLILSFNHNHNHDLDNKNDNYFVNQKNMYLRFSKTLPKNVQIVFRHSSLQVW